MGNEIVVHNFVYLLFFAFHKGNVTSIHTGVLGRQAPISALNGQEGMTRHQA